MKNLFNKDASRTKQPFPRNAFALLGTALVLTAAPHAWQLSPWVIGVVFLLGFWRVQIYRDRWSHPGPWMKIVLVVVCITGVVELEPSGFTLEAATSLVMMAFALKFLEMKSRRDAYVVIYLAYFVIAIEFLFNQSIAITLYEVGALVFVTAAMVGLNQLRMDDRPVRAVKVAATLVAQALPLMIVAFFLLPRLGPMWGVPVSTNARTGIATHIRPGDIANLIQSDDIAMRITFDGETPPRSSMYWRGLVYSDYDNGTWRVSPDDVRYNFPLPDMRQASYRYEVLQQPTSAKWLFGISMAFTDQTGVETTRDFKMLAPDPLSSVYRYSVRSYVGQAMDATDVLAPSFYQRETRIPPNANPRIQAFANELFAQSTDDEDFINRILAHVRNGPFIYTLQPQALSGSHTIDQFWFDTREGFCAHFAGTFVFIMRSVGIPARLIGGYQGGEMNPLGDHLVVRQYDAHAWAEVWKAGKGWQLLDPTTAIAPERIRSGFSSGLSPAQLDALSPFGVVRLREIELLADIMNLFDSLEHRWTLWVLGYDQIAQRRFMRNLLDAITPTRAVVLFVSVSALAFACVRFAGLMGRRRYRVQPVVYLFLAFTKRVKRMGFERSCSESPAAFVKRIAIERNLDSTLYMRVVRQLNAFLYKQTGTPTPRELRNLRRLLFGFQLRLAVRSAG